MRRHLQRHRTTCIAMLMIAGTAASGCRAGVAGVRAGTAAIPSDASCTAPTTSGRVTVSTPGSPFQALATHDGCWIFVSVIAQPPASPGIAVYRRTAEGLSLARVVPLPTAPAGMAATHDERMLVVTAASRLSFLSIPALINGGNPVLGHMIDTTAK